MRLIHTSHLTFEEFYNNRNLPKYAILSHCWGDPKTEVSYQALRDGVYDEASYGWRKISECCRIARENGLDWAWIDTCCINKDSRAELTEAINSMFEWYRRSTECYVFLPDVEVVRLPDRHISRDWPTGRWRDQYRDPDTAEDIRSFASSRWFTRGWTLQELLAPANLEFFNRDFTSLGTKWSLAEIIYRSIGIEIGFLDHPETIRHASVAKRMSWAAERSTTRVEDAAYSLLGIFDVNMPLLYGEGEQAFFRLQSAIIEPSDDDSIFAWGLDVPIHRATGTFATAPIDFQGSKDIVRNHNLYATGANSFELTNKGVRYKWISPLPYWDDLCTAILGVSINHEIIRLQCKHRISDETVVLDLSSLPEKIVSYWATKSRAVAALATIAVHATQLNQPA